ncbi:Non-heme 11 kDa protein of cytochrome bc1 complex [Gymnopus androsaceus JB14]|uniref:Non-heme 11 kDa protein of cytochrome bc1 complex n=1 Tax=Gymnopus androsaceus JB14 TaxID=1447944 RepID=A0A6A4HZE6_9AGAR|nr:Non-heme 11 kDa protein of cytochrome bc1 complex [Gymnopus androsaceus JB14]
MNNSLTSFFSSFLPTIQADAESEKPAAAEESSSKEATESGASAEEGEAEEEPAAEEEEEEEEEPEDAHPTIRADCQSSSKCAPLAKHFEHCQEKVNAGEGFKGEDCVEEMFHMMHCVDDCAAPKLFAKLR